MADLAVVIVNYNSGWYCANFVDSLLDQRFTRADGRAGELGIVVVDNASPEPQRALLDPLAARGVKVVYAPDNTGYSGGCNFGMQHVDAPFVMVANPDVVLFPGTIDKLMRVLYADPDCGIVGPQAWIDPGFHFVAPPVELPTPGRHLVESLGRAVRFVGRRYGRARSRRALRTWVGEAAIRTEAVCGFCAIMPAELARELGPFDPGFPLYYEDADLSRRIAARGRRRVLVQDAPAIHFYNKSAGQEYSAAVKKYRHSKSYYFAKHSSRLSHWMFRWTTGLLERHAALMRGTRYERREDLACLVDAPEVDTGTDAACVAELTMDPSFALAAGALHGGGRYRFPDATWRALDATVYFLRFVDPVTLRTLRAYRFEKISQPEPIPPYAELLATYVDRVPRPGVFPDASRRSVSSRAVHIA